MTTDFRALCAELVDELNGLSAHVESTIPFETVLSGIRAYNRARAALAEREPEGPTDEELWGLYDEMGGAPEDAPWVRKYARAVLARWGQPS